jgi:long-chain acyl-CoA synthetase
VINERGCLVIIDRKKNIFKLAQGEYIAPEKIENVYAKDPLVAQIFVHGDSLQSSLVAIMVPDPEMLPGFVAAKAPKLAKQNLSYADLCKNPEVNALVLAQLTKVGKKAGLNGFELAKAIYLETELFSMENDLLTPTFKVKRPQAQKYYEAEIAAMYETLAANQPEKAKL